MSQIIKNEEGEDTEVFTADEIEEQKQVAIEEFKANNPDRTVELAEYQEKLREAEERLAKVGNEDKNFAALRKGKEDAEKRLSEFTKSIDDKINTVKREVLEGVMQDHKNDTLKQLSGNDPELEKKIEFHYKRLGDIVATKAEISKKLTDAYVLATQKEDDGVNMSVFSSGGVGRVKINNTSPKFSAEEKELASKFGLTDKDLTGK